MGHPGILIRGYHSNNNNSGNDRGVTDFVF